MNLSPSFQLGKSWLWHALFFGLLLLIQVSLALFREQPLRMSDEAVFLANALYLSGSGPMPTLHGAHYSAFGYSLFLVPAYWIFDHPNTIYTACLIISAFLLSTLYFGLYYVLKSLLGTPSRPAASSCVPYLSLSSNPAPRQLRMGRRCLPAGLRVSRGPL